MSQIASFYLLKDGRRQELSNGDCSGAVYMAIWDWCESELDLDVRFPAPQTEDTLDCALLEGELASNVLAALQEQYLPELAAEIAPDWDLPTEAVQSGLVWGDRIFEKCGIRRDEGGDGGKTLEIRGKRRLSARDGGANYQQS